VIAFALAANADGLAVLKPETFAHHVERFNTMEDENVTNFIPNAASWAWLQKEIPFFECPDREVEEMYYFRWWSFRKHIVQTTNGFVITEFLTPVKHAGIFNTISCAAGFHIAEGRWLHGQKYLDDYTRFWFHGESNAPPKKFHNFSSWLAAAAYDRWLVSGDARFATNLLGDFVADYRGWERERQLTNGLFWQFDVRDGMEESISGSRTDKNIRPTINIYMAANAQAVAATARLAGDSDVAREFSGKATTLQRLMQESLWDAGAKFFKVRLEKSGQLSDAREEIGFIPWMFNLPGAGKNFEAAWSQFTDTNAFRAPFGITTAERRHPQFRSHGVGKCEWDGAVWPFATSQTLVALANVLREDDDKVGHVAPRAPSSEPSMPGAHGVTRPTNADYFSAFMTYTHSQHADGKPYIGEYLDEKTGAWINGANGRSRYYNHSTFADLLITGVVGLHPRADDVVEISPLLPDGTWDWFCLDGVNYHGHTLTILWDKDGKHYAHGKGLIVLADGKEIAHGKKLAMLTGRLP
jgi:hypothetical protein